MATKIDYKLAPSFDIDSESHLFRQWLLMWAGFESLSGISAMTDANKKKKTRLQAFQLAVTKETLRTVQHLSITDRGDLDEILKALENHIVGTTNEVFERREFWRVRNRRVNPLLITCWPFENFPNGVILKNVVPIVKNSN